MKGTTMANSSTESVAIVTGASRGYGYGIAKCLKAKGFTVWITDINEGSLAKAAADLGVNRMKADVTSGKDWDALVEAVMKDGGRIDVLVNNAGGGGKIAPVEEQTDETIDQNVVLTLSSVMYGCRRVAPVMKRQKSGTIVNISSICAREAWPGWAVYSAGKAAIVQFSKCLYTELREHRVRITTVIPSWGSTGFNESAKLDAWSADIDQQVIKPEELGDVVATIAALPSHLEMLDVTLLPLVQEIMPL